MPLSDKSRLQIKSCQETKMSNVGQESMQQEDPTITSIRAPKARPTIVPSKHCPI